MSPFSTAMSPVPEMAVHHLELTLDPMSHCKNMGCLGISLAILGIVKMACLTSSIVSLSDTCMVCLTSPSCLSVIHAWCDVRWLHLTSEVWSRFNVFQSSRGALAISWRSSWLKLHLKLKYV